jgi:hypothetical protein
MIEGCETAFNGLYYQFTTGKPLKSLKLTLNYDENDTKSLDDQSALVNKAPSSLQFAPKTVKPVPITLTSPVLVPSFTLISALHHHRHHTLTKTVEIL